MQIAQPAKGYDILFRHSSDPDTFALSPIRCWTSLQTILQLNNNVQYKLQTVKPC